MGRIKGQKHTPKFLCSDCNTAHAAGAPCPDPETDTRPSLPDEYRLNILDHRIHGLHEVSLDLKYNPDFAASMGSSARLAIKRLEEAYQREYAALAAKLEAERKA